MRGTCMKKMTSQKRYPGPKGTQEAGLEFLQLCRAFYPSTRPIQTPLAVVGPGIPGHEA